MFSTFEWQVLSEQIAKHHGSIQLMFTQPSVFYLRHSSRQENGISPFLECIVSLYLGALAPETKSATYVNKMSDDKMKIHLCKHLTPSNEGWH